MLLTILINFIRAGKKQRKRFFKLSLGEIHIWLDVGFGIFAARLGPMFEKYSLNLFTISFLSVIIVLPDLKDLVITESLPLFKIVLIICQVFLIFVAEYSHKFRLFM